MKQLEVKHLGYQQVKVTDIPALFKDNSVSYNKIGTMDWAAEFPYCPQVELAVAHKGDAILLHYRVEKDCVRAKAGTDLGPIWQDSCYEFFCSPDEEEGCYNLRNNCIDTVLLCNGQGRGNRTHAPAAALEQIDRWVSLGREPFEMREEQQAWELTLVVPVSSYFHHTLDDLSGKMTRTSFYKCGNKTSQPHFLSWNPIALPSPDFHCPAFSGELNLE